MIGEYSEDWDQVKGALLLLAYSVAVAVAAYLLPSRDHLKYLKDGVSVLAPLAISAALGALSIKIVFRFEPEGSAAVSNWHFGQVAMATLAIVCLTMLGIAAVFVSMISMELACPGGWEGVCTAGTWVVGIYGVVYALALGLAVPVLLWWDAFNTRGSRARLARENVIREALVNAREQGRQDAIEQMRLEREQRKLRRRLSSEM